MPIATRGATQGILWSDSSAIQEGNAETSPQFYGKMWMNLGDLPTQGHPPGGSPPVRLPPIVALIIQAEHARRAVARRTMSPPALARTGTGGRSS